MSVYRRYVVAIFLFAGISFLTVGCNPSTKDTPDDSPKPDTSTEQPADKPESPADETPVEKPPVEPPVAPPVEEPKIDAPPVEEPPAEPPVEQPPVEAPADPNGLPNPLRDPSSPTEAERPVTPPMPLTPIHPEQPALEPTTQDTPAAGKAHSAGKGHDDRPPFDPIKENGPIFVGWEKPKLALLISGQQIGYIEPCGCAGLDRMKGGMSRRHTLVRQLGEKGWPLVAIDVGGIAKGFGRQAQLKFHVMVEGMRKMGYDAIALGTTDLKLPAGEVAVVAASDPDNPSPFISGNVGLFGFDAGLTAKTHIVEKGGMKLGITAVLGKKEQKEIANDEIEMADPAEALEKIVPELKTKADFLILLCHGTREETVALAKQFPDFDLVVTAGGPAEPPAKPDMVEGTDTPLIEVGEKGMNAVVLGFYDDPKQPMRYQRVPLDSRFPGSEDMRLLMASYQDQLKQLGYAGLGIKPVPHPQTELNGKFVGSRECKSCHEESYKVWKKSGHAKAFETLENLDPPRHFDPECISCHVIGWHPTKYFPYKGGYDTMETTPKLIDVGCESCHGPGGAHVKAEQGADLALQEKLQKAMVVTNAEARDIHSSKACINCHDGDNSPGFDFDTYWPKVEHYESE